MLARTPQPTGWRRGLPALVVVGFALLLCASSLTPTASARRAKSGHETRVHGVVRDASDRPLARVLVREKRSRTQARTGRSGRFVLRLGSGRRTLTASRPSYGRQRIRLRLRRKTRSVSFRLPRIGRRSSETPRNSADRIVFWLRCDTLPSLTDRELDEWRRRGVGGFACQGPTLEGLGGTARFTGDSDADLSDSRYVLQRRLRSSRVIERARQRGMKSYLGFYASNQSNPATPLREWFDDEAWDGVVVPRVRELSAAARSLGFAGVAVDQELYGRNARTATWEWTYPGNTHGEAAVRAKVAQRGRELMDAMVEQFPGLQLAAYDTRLTDSWDSFVQASLRGGVPYADDVRIDLWNGLTSVPGYSAIRWLDAAFYKTPRLAGASWDAALQYNVNRLYSLLSRRLSAWSYASRRLHITPFSWIDRGPDSDEGARPAPDVAAQLAAFRKWGTGGEFANFSYAGLRGFDYGPYLGGLRAASSPGQVDRERPRLAITSPRANRVAAGKRKRLDIAGRATDNLAIRAVRWRDGEGRGGAATMKWVTSTGSYRRGWSGRTEWLIRGVPLARGASRLVIEVEDIKGMTSAQTLRVTRTR